MVNVDGDLISVGQFYAAMYWGKCAVDWGLFREVVYVPLLRRHRLCCVYIVCTVIYRTPIYYAEHVTSLVGISVVQGYLYFTRSNKDRGSMKAIVSLVISVMVLKN